MVNESKLPWLVLQVELLKRAVKTRPRGRATAVAVAVAGGVVMLAKRTRKSSAEASKWDLLPHVIAELLQFLIQRCGERLGARCAWP